MTSLNLSYSLNGSPTKCSHTWASTIVFGSENNIYQLTTASYVYPLYMVQQGGSHLYTVFPSLVIYTTPHHYLNQGPDLTVYPGYYSISSLVYLVPVTVKPFYP